MNKEQQKQLITEIMNLDAKDGLYDTVSELDKLAEKTFKGDDATVFVQREIWKDGYRKAQETRIDFLVWLGENKWHKYKDGRWFTLKETPYMQEFSRKFYKEEEVVQIFSTITSKL
jgi:hypothetical protein